LSVPLFSLLTLGAPAQTADPVTRVFHPASPLLSYEVATIKPLDPDPATGRTMVMGQTLRDFIRRAYAPTFVELAPSQVVGGPDWIDREKYVINGKAPAEIETAMQKMTTADQVTHEHSMEQSLLADRFHLKVHFEVREMPVYALEPAKGGLKIHQVAAPPPRDPAAPPSRPVPAGKPLNAGTMMTWMGAGGVRTANAHATTTSALVRLLSTLLDETGNRPIVDQTGFTGYFDITDLKWASLSSPDSQNSSDLPSLPTALEENLGIRLVSTKGPVEVVVIDGIDHPSEN
jgi:uncharacterized protein (TIGR03435 family)